MHVVFVNGVGLLDEIHFIYGNKASVMSVLSPLSCYYTSVQVA